jgi:hypothetical protein
VNGLMQKKNIMNSLNRKKAGTIVILVMTLVFPILFKLILNATL